MFPWNLDQPRNRKAGSRGRAKDSQASGFIILGHLEPLLRAPTVAAPIPHGFLGDTFPRIRNTFDLFGNTFEVIQNSFESIPNTFDLFGDTFEVIQNTFEGIPNTFDLFGDTFEVIPNTFEGISNTFDLFGNTFEGVGKTGEGSFKSFELGRGGRAVFSLSGGEYSCASSVRRHSRALEAPHRTPLALSRTWETGAGDRKHGKSRVPAAFPRQK